MRRLIIVFGAILILLAAASPAAAAPPDRQSSVVESASASASSCEPQGAWLSCTDVSVDFFVDASFGVTDACVSVFTYRVRANGSGFQQLDEQSGCGPVSAADVADNLSSATLSPSTIPLFECGPSDCTQAGTLTVAGEWTAIGDPIPHSSRSTFKDGTCTFTQTTSGAHAEATALLTVGDETYDAAFAFISHEESTFTQRCR